MMSRATDGAGQYPVFDQAPLYLRLSLIFPYTKGMLFQHAVFLRDGQDGFGAVFRHAPVSTQQILHPEKYFDSVVPTSPELPQPPKQRGWKSLVGGSFGELEHSVLLEQYGGKTLAADLAPHWRGSQFEIRENRKLGLAMLLYAVEFDDEPSAGRYFRFYLEAMGKKWKRREVASQSAAEAAGTGDDGRFVLRLDGKTVTSMEGLPPAVN